MGLKKINELLDRFNGSGIHNHGDAISVGIGSKDEREKAEIIARVKAHDSGRKFGVFVSDKDMKKFDEYQKRYDEIFGTDDDEDEGDDDYYEDDVDSDDEVN